MRTIRYQGYKQQLSFFATLRVFLLQALASSCLPQQILNFPSNLFLHFDEKAQEYNSLELPNPTRNTQKFGSTDQYVAQQLTTFIHELFTPCRLHHKP